MIQNTSKAKHNSITWISFPKWNNKYWKNIGFINSLYLEIEDVILILRKCIGFSINYVCYNINIEKMLVFHCISSLILTTHLIWNCSR